MTQSRRAKDNQLRMPGDDSVSVTPKYLIGRVTKLTGLSVDVVRVWERRYSAVQPARSDGGTRLYSDADIRRLQRLRQAVDGGYSISQAARLSEAELDELIAGTQPLIEAADPYRAVRERFIDAVRTMDAVAADLELARAATLFPARELVSNVIVPILEEIGDRWAESEFGVAHEHLASGLLRGMLGSLLRLYPQSSRGDTMVLATPAGERHEFGLMIVALMAASRGWRVVFLGADIPATEIARAVRLTSPRVLALSVVTDRMGTSKELSEIASLVPFPTRIWIGGAEAPKYEELITRANWILIRKLDELEDRLGE